MPENVEEQLSVKYTLADILRFQSLLTEDTKPNVLPEQVQRMRTEGVGTPVEVMVDQSQDLRRRGLLVSSTGDIEKNQTGLDVVYLSYSPLRKKEMQIRLPLSSIRLDQICIMGEAFAPTPTSTPQESIAKVTDEVMKGLSASDLAFLRGSNRETPSEKEKGDGKPQNRTCPTCGEGKHWNAKTCDECRKRGVTQEEIEAGAYVQAPEKKK